MGWLIALACTALHLFIMVRLTPKYLRAMVENDRIRWPSIHNRRNAIRQYMGEAIIKAFFWPITIPWQYASDYAVHALTADERREAEAQKARRIIADWEEEKRLKERKALNEFDRKLRD